MSPTMVLFFAAALFVALTVFGLSLAANAIARGIRGRSSFGYAICAGLVLAIPAVTVLPKWWFV